MRVAEAFGSVKILSSACKPDFEEVARECSVVGKIYQLYVMGDEAWMMENATDTPPR